MKRAGFVLHDYQEEGVKKMSHALLHAFYVSKSDQYKACNCFLLYDEMGLGKTVQVLETIDRLKLSPVLVVCPGACVPVWKEEITKRFPGRFGEIRELSNADKKPISPTGVVICTYEMLRTQVQNYLQDQWENQKFSAEDLEMLCVANGIETGHLQMMEKLAKTQQLLGLVNGLFGKKGGGPLKDYHRQFFNTNFGVLVMDEIHRIRNPASATAKALGFFRRVKYRIGLSGTPIVNHPKDLLGILKCGLGLFDVQWHTVLKNPNSAYWQDLIGSISLGRTKADVPELSDILPKRQHTEEGELQRLDSHSDSIMESVYCAIKRETIRLCQQNNKIHTNSFMTKMTALRQTCLHPTLAEEPFRAWYVRRIVCLLLCLERICPPMCKNLRKRLVDAVVEADDFRHKPSLKMLCVRDYLAHNPGEKAIVFCTFKEFFTNIFKPWLTSIGVESVLFAGGEDKRFQKVALASFNDDDDVRVMMIVKQAGGEGLNLQAKCRTVFVMDPHFNSAVDEQAIKRIDRIGQTRDVCVKKLVIKDSIDELFMKLQEQKNKQIESFTKNKEDKSFTVIGANFILKDDKIGD